LLLLLLLLLCVNRLTLCGSGTKPGGLEVCRAGPKLLSFDGQPNASHV
jgi:hypothetical protein